MKNKPLYFIWLGLLALCAGLGFLPNPDSGVQGLCVILAVICFVPPAVIVYRGWKDRDWEALRLVRNLAIGSLVVTVAALIGNFFTLAAPTWVGDLLYAVLVMVSTPMICGQFWIMSLLLWAAMLWTCVLLLGKKR